MKKVILSLAFIFLVITLGYSFTKAGYVYHEQTTSKTPGCGTDNYVSTDTPSNSEAFVITFRVESKDGSNPGVNRIKLYYTTNGTDPSGSWGTGNAGTTVLDATFSCEYTDSDIGNKFVQVYKVSIPAQPDGTEVRYIMSAWEDGNGDELFANSGPNDAGASDFFTAADATKFTYVVGSPLPILLTSFEAQATQSTVSLSWSTTTEINNSFFTIERSTDNKSWEAVAKVDGAGNSNRKHDYQYIDKSAMNGTNYYQLRQTDFDGRFSLSEIVSVEVRKGDYTLYPTIVKDIVFLRESELGLQINILNSLGQKVLSDHNTNQVDVSNLPQGWYFAQAIESNQPIFIGRFYKL